MASPSAGPMSRPLPPPLKGGPAAPGTAPGPKRGPGRPAGSATAKASPPQGHQSIALSQIESRIAGLYTTLGVTIGFAKPDLGVGLIESGPAAAKAIREVCQNNPKVRKQIEKLLQTSDIGKLIVAHIPFFIGIAITMKPDKKADILDMKAMIQSMTSLTPADLEQDDGDE